MTSLPTRLALRPEVAGIGISVANIAVAGNAEELNIALDALRKNVAAFKGVLSEISDQVQDFQRDIISATGQDLLNALGYLSVCELFFSEMLDVIKKVVDKHKGGETIEKVRFELLFSDMLSLRDVLDVVYIPIIRRARLSAITLVFRRTSERGVEGADLDTGFAAWFLAASREETEGWQETAQLLAIPEDADRLLHSIRSSPHDRTDEILGPA